MSLKKIMLPIVIKSSFFSQALCLSFPEVDPAANSTKQRRVEASSAAERLEVVLAYGVLIGWRSCVVCSHVSMATSQQAHKRAYAHFTPHIPPSHSQTNRQANCQPPACLQSKLTDKPNIPPNNETTRGPTSNHACIRAQQFRTSTNLQANSQAQPYVQSERKTQT